MHKRDYTIIISADINDKVYWQMLRKGEPAACNEEEQKLAEEMLGEVFRKLEVNAFWRQADALLMADVKPTLKMRRININNPEELKKFKMETSGFVSTYGFPYRLDDLTEKGANYTVFCPLRWKSAFSPAKLHKLLREDVDADVIKVEYVDFVKE
jgi:hypothetical protein